MARQLSVILQTEMSECGLACIAMIARYYGHDIDLNVLREKFLVSLKGAPLKSVIDVAGSLGLGARPLRLDLDKLGDLQTPAILHWDFNHYVVLKSVRNGKAHIHDPGVGLRVLPLSRVSDHFTGIALELTPTIEFMPVTARLKPYLSQLWTKLIGIKRAIFQTLSLSILLQVIVLSLPFFLQIVVDGVLPTGDTALLWGLVIGFGALAILRALAEATRGFAILVYGNQMSAQMMGNVFRHLIRLPTAYFEKRHVGDIISRIGSTRPIQEAITQSVVGVMIDGIMAVLMLAVMFWYAPLLGATVLASVAVLALVTCLIYPHMRRTEEEAIYAQAIENTHVIESIRASTTVKLFGREAQREAAWRNLYADVVNANVDHGKYVILQKFSETLIVGLQLVCVVWLATHLMLDPGSGFSVGMLVAFLAYRQYFTDSITQLLQKGIEFSLLRLHLDRLADIIFAKAEHISDATPKALTVTGDLTLDNVSFRYSPLDPWVVQNISLNIKAGEMVTLTGRSGGGKTTLMKLMLGLYSPSKGEIRIDGQDLSQIDVRAWRAHIGVVMQDDRLLSGTIAENISFFDPETDIYKVVQAAKAAHIHDEIMAIPMNYMSLVGDMGSVLSGGQKQRVLLARALYAEPKVLFLDEGTANLDVKTEKQIVDVISQMKLTRVIVAHRPAFLNESDRIIEI